MNNQNNLKTLVSLPQWAVEMMEGGASTGEVKNAADAYIYIPLIRRAVDIRANTLKRVPLYINGELDNTPFDIFYPANHTIGITDLLGLIESALLLRGGALVVSLRNSYNFSRGMQYVNPFTLTVEWDDAKQTQRFYQQIDGKRYPTNKSFWYDGEDAYFFREYHPLTDIGFGASATDNALGDARMLNYLTIMSAQFFKGGALPITMLPVPPGTPDGEVSRIERFFRDAFARAKRVLAFRSQGDKFQPYVFTPKFVEMDIPSVRQHAIDAVAWAFDVPKTLLTADSANYATAGAEMANFIQNTIMPRCQYYQEQFERMGITLEFEPEEMPELQEDENARAGAVGSFTSALAQDVDAAVIAMALLGVDIDDETQALIDAYKAQKEQNKADMQEQLQQKPDAANTDTGGEMPMDNSGDNAPMDEEAQAEAKAFRKWYAKRAARGSVDVSQFEFSHLKKTEQNALISELTAPKVTAPIPTDLLSELRAALEA